jgi:hypothetical protein
VLGIGYNKLTSLSPPRRQRQHDQHQWDSHQQSSELNLARLSPHLRQFGRIFSLCDAIDI